MWSSGTTRKRSDFVLCIEVKKINIKPWPFCLHQSSMCFFQSHFRILHTYHSLRRSWQERKESKAGILPIKSVEKIFRAVSAQPEELLISCREMGSKDKALRTTGIPTEALSAAVVNTGPQPNFLDSDHSSNIYYNFWTSYSCPLSL